MKILSKKEQDKILIDVCAIKIMLNQLDRGDVEFIKKSLKGLSDIALIVGGVSGAEKVKRIAEMWKGKII